MDSLQMMDPDFRTASRLLYDLPPHWHLSGTTLRFTCFMKPILLSSPLLWLCKCFLMLTFYCVNTSYLVDRCICPAPCRSRQTLEKNVLSWALAGTGSVLFTRQVAVQPTRWCSAHALFLFLFGAIFKSCQERFIETFFSFSVGYTF